MTKANEIFTEKEIKKIEQIKKDVAAQVSQYLPLFLLEPNFNFQSSWFLAGGFFSSIVNNHPDSDLDVWIFKDHMKITKLLEHRKCKFYGNMEYSRRDIVSYIFNETKRDKNIQYIFTPIKSPESLVDTFDYIHCQPFYYNHILTLSKQQYEAVVQKQLIQTGINTPNKRRVDKWLARGYKSVR